MTSGVARCSNDDAFSRCLAVHESRAGTGTPLGRGACAGCFRFTDHPVQLGRVESQAAALLDQCNRGLDRKPDSVAESELDS